LLSLLGVYGHDLAGEADAGTKNFAFAERRTLLERAESTCQIGNLFGFCNGQSGWHNQRRIWRERSLTNFETPPKRVTKNEIAREHFASNPSRRIKSAAEKREELP
jgi:hypothetical protein